MSIVRISFGYSRMNASEVAESAEETLSKMAAEPGIYPAPNPSLSIVGNALAELRQSISNASRRDGLMVGKRQEKKTILENLLKLLSSYAVNVTSGDKIALEKGGWKIIEPRPVAPLVPPTSPKLSFIKGKSGQLKLRWKGAKGMSYLVEFTDQSIIESPT